MKRLAILLLVLALPVLAVAVLSGTPGLRLAIWLASSDTLSIEHQGLTGSIWTGADADSLQIRTPQADVLVRDLTSRWQLSLDPPGITIDQLDSDLIDIQLTEQGAASSSGSQPGNAISGEAGEAFDLPVSIVLQQSRFGRIRLTQANGDSLGRNEVQFAGHWHHQHFSIDQLRWTAPDVVQLSGNLDLASWDYQFDARWRPTQGQPEWRVRMAGDPETGVFQGGSPAFGLAANGTVQWAGLLPEYDLAVEYRPPASDIDAQFAVQGDIYSWQAQGVARIETIEFHVPSSRFRMDAEQLNLDSMTIRLNEPQVQASATGSLNLQSFDSILDINWQATLTEASPTGPGIASGTLALTGIPDDWSATVVGDMPAGGDLLSIYAEMRGDQQTVSADPIRLNHAAGAGELSATLDLETLAWRVGGQLDHIDLSVLSSGLASNISGTVNSFGTGDHASVELTELDGQLQGYPVSGSARLAMQAGQVSAVSGELASGTSHIQLNAADGLDGPAELRLEIDDFGHFHAGASGRASGTLSAVGRWPDTELQGSLTVDQVRFEKLSIGRAVAELDHQPGAAGALNLAINASTLAIKGYQWQTIDFTAGGTLDAATFELASQGEIGAVHASGSGNANAIQLDALSHTSASTGNWQLRDPASIDLTGDRPRLIGPACLSSTTANICLSDRDNTVELSWAAFPMRLISPLVGHALERQVTLNGVSQGRVTATVGVSPDSDSDSASGSDPDSKTNPIAIDAQLGGDQLRIGFSTDPDEDVLVESWHGRLSGSKTVQFDARAQGANGDAVLKVSGIIEGLLTGVVENIDLTVDAAIGHLERLAVSQERAIGSGSVHARLLASGPPDNLDLSGELEVDDLALPVIRVGTGVREGQLRLAVNPAGRFSATGSARLGDGILDISGDGEWQDNHLVGEINLTASQALLADLPELRVVSDVDLRLALASEGVDLTGTITVIDGAARLGPVESAVRPSPDTVFIDDRPAETGADALNLPVRASIRLQLANPVALAGFGIQAEVSGAIDVEEIPGQITLATGELRAEGEIRYQGKRMQISDGRVSFSRSPLDNPNLRVEATTRVPAGTVGVRISGAARNPKVDLFSDPPMNETEILSNLLLGRSTNQLNSSSAVSAALAGLRASGAIESQSVAGIEVDVETSDQGLGLSLGRFLSPQLYLSYTIGLVDQLDQLSLNYQLGRNWSIETELGIEARATIKYHVETGHPTTPGGPPDQ